MDDYGNDMLDIADAFTIEQENTVCRWIADGITEEFPESFLRSIEAI